MEWPEGTAVLNRDEEHHKWVPVEVDRQFRPSFGNRLAFDYSDDVTRLPRRWSHTSSLVDRSLRQSLAAGSPNRVHPGQFVGTGSHPAPAEHELVRERLLLALLEDQHHSGLALAV